jgi:hypothetical protein
MFSTVDARATLFAISPTSAQAPAQASAQASMNDLFLSDMMVRTIQGFFNTIFQKRTMNPF